MEKIKNNLYMISVIIFTIGLNILHFLTPMIGDDYWWHIKAGEYIVENKTIPFTDIFSWFGVENQLYWHSHEWLSEVVFYIVSLPLGNLSVYIFILLLTVLLQFFLIYANRKIIFKNKLMGIVWIFLGVLLINQLLTPRPHMIGFLLFTSVIYLLFDFIKNNSNKIWLLPVISILWANFHGGSSNLVYIIPFIFLIVGLFNFNLGKIEFKSLPINQIKTLSIVSILAFLCIAINPHGLDMITYPYINMGDSFMLSFISEWRSPDLKRSADIFIFILLFLTYVILIFTDKKVKGIDLALLLAFTYLTCQSIRFGIFLYIVASFTLLDYIKEVNIDKKYLNYLSSFLISIGIAISSNIMNINSIVENPIVAPLTDEMIKEVKNLDTNRLYNDYNYGGYLLYNDIDVFVDSRADMYSKYNLVDAINIMGLHDSSKDPNREEFNINEVLDKYDFDALIIQKNRPLNAYLQNSSEYELVYEDNNSILYRKK